MKTTSIVPEVKGPFSSKEVTGDRSNGSTESFHPSPSSSLSTPLGIPSKSVSHFSLESYG